jgi:hypothetical protein
MSSEHTKSLDIERSFGMGVLLKLTKKNVGGIDISTDGKRFSSNVSVRKLSEAVDKVLAAHNIRLKID